MIILKWLLHKYDGRVETDLLWLKIRTNDGFMDT
jgi:hypothetical protein